jgi:hypothetical protein
MTYENTLTFIENEQTGIAKGYDFSFLQSFYSRERLEAQVAFDLASFKTIEENLLGKNEPKEGEWVEYAEGEYARLSRIGDTVQVSNQVGIYVWENGAQASGCTWDPDLDHLGTLYKSDLIATTETKKGRCWTFSGNQAGPGRGVYFEINFKVWKLARGGAQ